MWICREYCQWHTHKLKLTKKAHTEKSDVMRWFADEGANKKETKFLSSATYKKRALNPMLKNKDQRPNSIWYNDPNVGSQARLNWQNEFFKSLTHEMSTVYFAKTNKK